MDYLGIHSSNLIRFGYLKPVRLKNLGKNSRKWLLYDIQWWYKYICDVEMSDGDMSSKKFLQDKFFNHTHI